MIEAYLDHLTRMKNEKTAITPLVESLSVVFDLPLDYDYKKDYTNHITEKYK